MEIYYKNTKGERLNLTEWPYRVYAGDFLDYSWEYNYTSRQFGGKIYGFTRPVREHQLTLSVKAESKAAYYGALEAFYRTVEIDVLKGIPGRLYVNGSHLNCYIIESQKTEWEGDCDSLDNEIKVVAEHPFWIEETGNFYPAVSAELVEYEYLNYPYGYAYDYMPSRGNYVVVNSHFADSEFVLQFYGPCSYPSVKIGNFVYGVNTNILAGYRAEINSADKTVRLVSDGGQDENIFHLRTTENSVFTKIEQGMLSVQKNGAFDMAVILRNERSEPRWT